MKLRKFLGLLLALFITFSFIVSAKDGFSSRNAYNITKELSSEKYKGRLVGDSGNKLARDYIKKYFKELGLKPGGDSNSFLQEFDVYVPIITGSCYFKVYDESSNLVKEYKYGMDFKEMTYGASISGKVTGNIKTALRAQSSIIIEENISSAFENPKGYTNDLELMANGVKAMIIPGDEYLRFRSPYKLQKKYDRGLVKIYASREIITELRSFAEKNYSFELQNGTMTKLTKGSNVIGILEGKDKTLPPLILSAHFDHVGFDFDGVIYPGSLDNASGTGFLLECARALSNLKQPDRTIMFVAFDGEEVGLIGSKYFIDNPPMDISESECINFDMVGSSSKLPVSIIYSSQRDELASELLSLSKLENIPAKTSVNDSSDHASFCSNGINAVTLIQYDVSRIHTPDDTMENVSENGFRDVYEILELYFSSRKIHPSFLNKQISNPGIRYLLPGAVILIVASMVVMYFVNRKKQDNINC